MDGGPAGVWAEVQKIPLVTRTLVLGTLAVTIPCMVKVLSPYKIILSWSLVIQHLQLWRIPSSFLYGGEKLDFLFNLIMLYRHSNSLETGHFGHRTADYAWAVALMGLIILALGVQLGSMIHFKPLLMALIYLEAQTHPYQQISLYGFINMASIYFPWALVAIDFVINGSGAVMQSLTGIMAAHAYWYFTQVYPRSHNGRQVLSTPAALKSWLGNGGRGQTLNASPGGIRLTTPTGPARAGSRATAGASATTTGHSWGSGQRLGSG